MAQEAPARAKIPATGPRPGRQAGEIQPHGIRQDARERDRACGHPGRRPGDRAGMRITVYPAREEQGRWRAVWRENGARQQCEAASEEKLAAKLAKVTERLEADAPSMSRPGADYSAPLRSRRPACGPTVDGELLARRGTRCTQAHMLVSALIRRRS